MFKTHLKNLIFQKNVPNWREGSHCCYYKFLENRKQFELRNHYELNQRKCLTKHTEQISTSLCLKCLDARLSKPSRYETYNSPKNIPCRTHSRKNKANQSKSQRLKSNFEYGWCKRNSFQTPTSKSRSSSLVSVESNKSSIKEQLSQRDKSKNIYKWYWNHNNYKPPEKKYSKVKQKKIGKLQNESLSPGNVYKLEKKSIIESKLRELHDFKQKTFKERKKNFLKVNQQESMKKLSRKISLNIKKSSQISKSIKKYSSKVEKVMELLKPFYLFGQRHLRKSKIQPRATERSLTKILSKTGGSGGIFLSERKENLNVRPNICFTEKFEDKINSCWRKNKDKLIIDANNVENQNNLKISDLKKFKTRSKLLCNKPSTDMSKRIRETERQRIVERRTKNHYILQKQSVVNLKNNRVKEKMKLSEETNKLLMEFLEDKLLNNESCMINMPPKIEPNYDTIQRCTKEKKILEEACGSPFGSQVNNKEEKKVLPNHSLLRFIGNEEGLNKKIGKLSTKLVAKAKPLPNRNEESHDKTVFLEKRSVVIGMQYVKFLTNKFGGSGVTHSTEPFQVFMDADTQKNDSFTKYEKLLLNSGINSRSSSKNEKEIEQIKFTLSDMMNVGRTSKEHSANYESCRKELAHENMKTYEIITNKFKFDNKSQMPVQERGWEGRRHY